MYGTTPSQSSSAHAGTTVTICGFAAAVAVAGLVGYVAPGAMYAASSVRPTTSAIPAVRALPSQRVATRPLMVSQAMGATEAAYPVTSSSVQVTLPVAFGLTAVAAFLGAILGRRQSSQSIAMAATSGERLVWLPGATPPAYLTGQYPGDRGFDPLGLSKDPKTFERMRISEVFHGRLAMLGIIGCLAPELLLQKGAWFEAGDNLDLYRLGVAALQVIAPLEYWRGNGGFGWNGEGLDRSYPGFDPLSLTNDNTKLKEIKNGRLAMIGMLGFEVQYHVTGKSPVANLAAHLADPLHANIAAGSVAMFSTSGQKERPLWSLWFPGGYTPPYLTGEFPGDRGCDPFGLAADPKTYERMRISEVFHGRLAMLAVVGAVVPEYLGKAPWYAAPELADMGLEQLGVFILIAGLPEYWRGQGGFSKGAYDKSYPGFDPLKLTTDYTKEAEIKNGRLAMTAIAGFFVQHQITGRTPIENLVDHWTHPLNSNIASTLMNPVAMFATSGHKDGVWFPGAKPAAHLTGEFPGDRGFDPLGLAHDKDVYARMRLSEVFHGRLAMTGVLAALVPELLGKGPWYEQNDLKVGLIVMAIAAPTEYWRGQGGFGWDKGTWDRSYPGFDPLKLTSDRTKVAEIKNGRLAMAAIAGFAVQHLVTGESPLANVAAHVSNPLGANIVANLS